MGVLVSFCKLWINILLKSVSHQDTAGKVMSHPHLIMSCGRMRWCDACLIQTKFHFGLKENKCTFNKHFQHRNVKENKHLSPKASYNPPLLRHSSSPLITPQDWWCFFSVISGCLSQSICQSLSERDINMILNMEHRTCLTVGLACQSVSGHKSPPYLPDCLFVCFSILSNSHESH